MPQIDFVQVAIVFAVLLISLTVHEAAHAWMADRLGDPTARLLGRVSLNPSVHVDPIGTVVFPLIAIVTGFPVIGWAKPVPVQVRNLHGQWQRKYMAIAAAGPASNLLLAVAAAVLLQVVPFSLMLPPLHVAGATIRTVLRMTVYVNVLLAIFNMIPVPPLDGGNVLAGLLRGPVADAYDRLRPYGFLILYALMFSGALTAILNMPTSLILSVLL